MQNVLKSLVSLSNKYVNQDSLFTFRPKRKNRLFLLPLSNFNESLQSKTPNQQHYFVFSTRKKETNGKQNKKYLIKENQSLYGPCGPSLVGISWFSLFECELMAEGPIGLMSKIWLDPEIR